MSNQNKVQNVELNAKITELSKELETLARNPISENEAGQIEGGFAGPLDEEADAAKWDVVINFGC